MTTIGSDLVIKTDRGMPLHTFTGREFYPLSPDPSQIVIEDIAHHLAAKPRYAGATLAPYSVAQHSVIVSMICPPEFALHGLLHDAAEAYMVDVPRPLKRLPALGAYRAIEDYVQGVILQRFGLSAVIPDAVHEADTAVLINEALDLFAPGAVPEWARSRARLDLPKITAKPAAVAERLFLNRFTALTEGRLS